MTDAYEYRWFWNLDLGLSISVKRNDPPTSTPSLSAFISAFMISIVLNTYMSLHSKEVMDSFILYSACWRSSNSLQMYSVSSIVKSSTVLNLSSSTFMCRPNISTTYLVTSTLATHSFSPVTPMASSPSSL